MELPIELYLRELFDLDLDDEEQLRGFSAQYGLLATPGLGEITPRYREADGTALRRGPRNEEQLRKLWAEMSLPPVCDAVSSTIAILLVDEFCLHVRLLRDLVRIFRAHKGEISFDEAWQSWESREFLVSLAGPASCGPSTCAAFWPPT